MSISLNTRSALTGTVTHLATDGIVKFDLSAWPWTFNLLSIATTGVYYRVIVGDDGSNAGTNNLTINAAGGDTINGSASYVIRLNWWFTVLESVDANKRTATVVDAANLSGILAIANGGTAASTISQAMINLNWLVRISTTGMNAKSAVNTSFSLYVVPAGKRFLFVWFVNEVTAATGAGNWWHVSIGTNAATYNNIMTNQTFNAADTTDEGFWFANNWVFVVATAGQDIRLNINTAATTTTMTCSGHLLGFLY